MTDAIDRDFGAEDERSWTVEELFDEITRRAVDAIESDFAPAPLLAILVDLARIRTKTTPEPTHTEGE